MRPTHILAGGSPLGSWAWPVRLAYARRIEDGLDRLPAERVDPLVDPVARVLDAERPEGRYDRWVMFALDLYGNAVVRAPSWRLRLWVKPYGLFRRPAALQSPPYAPSRDAVRGGGLRTVRERAAINCNLQSGRVDYRVLRFAHYPRSLVVLGPTCPDGCSGHLRASPAASAVGAPPRQRANGLPHSAGTATLDRSVQSRKSPSVSVFTPFSWISTSAAASASLLARMIVLPPET